MLYTHKKHIGWNLFYTSNHAAFEELSLGDQFRFITFSLDVDHHYASLAFVWDFNLEQPCQQKWSYIIHLIFYSHDEHVLLGFQSYDVWYL